MNEDELETFVQSVGEKKYRAAQLYAWLYAKHADTFDEMSNISKEFRDLLKQTATIEQIQLIASNSSQKDGTTKFLFRLSDGLLIESVLIPPEKDSPSADQRLTLCLSTQVGCPLDCKFCASGTMGFTRDLSASEILDQVIQSQRNSRRRITNIVYMGMGEPMLNYENVMKSVEITTSDRSLNISARRITISTAGYADKIRRMADDRRKVKLALSLHSLDNEKRTKLMPITKKFPVNELVDSLEYYYKRTRQRPTLEYILFDGFNDRNEDIQLLARLSRRVPSKVNLIPFHSIEFTRPAGFAASLRPASAERLEEFAQRLRTANVTVMIRSSAGEDINAACGQLAVREQEAERQGNAKKITSNLYSTQSL